VAPPSRHRSPGIILCFIGPVSPAVAVGNAAAELGPRKSRVSATAAPVTGAIDPVDATVLEENFCCLVPLSGVLRGRVMPGALRFTDAADAAIFDVAA